jgi:hypothetical protein
MEGAKQGCIHPKKCKTPEDDIKNNLLYDQIVGQKKIVREVKNQSGECLSQTKNLRHSLVHFSTFSARSG